VIKLKKLIPEKWIRMEERWPRSKEELDRVANFYFKNFKEDFSQDLLVDAIGACFPNPPYMGQHKAKDLKKAKDEFWFPFVLEWIRDNFYEGNLSAGKELYDIMKEYEDLLNRDPEAVLDKHDKQMNFTGSPEYLEIKKKAMRYIYDLNREKDWGFPENATGKAKYYYDLRNLWKKKKNKL